MNKARNDSLRQRDGAKPTADTLETDGRDMARRLHLKWRRREDLNPWGFRPMVFKTTALNHSATPPRR